ncbi:class I SAM-dependent methyltransferase [Humibacter sp.]|uniref:class I SAM-dependent methyltransferase n=1 Tax=Humibacter sp. TaxID=1940291 RepID=UPI002B7BCE87|nr:methyltransferase domain-containing protein [Humibacter sp.]HVX07924.1 methyltransferase domain-containing protein [Humibacter sp.]
MAAQSSSDGGYSHDFIASNAVVAARHITGMVRTWLEPASVVDFGCGLGVWLAEWAAHGCAIQGIDGDYVDRSALRIPERAFRAADLAQPVELERCYDLVMSLEVAEHLPAECADIFVESLTRHGDAILFSAAIPGQGGEHHVNCRWPSWWAAKFRAHGYDVFDVVRPRIWGNEDIAWWYRQNVLLYARGDAAERLAALPVVAAPMDVVHPRWWLDASLPRSLADESRAWIGAARQAVGRRLRKPGQDAR